MKRPFVVSLALVVSNRSPLENAREIFQGNPPLCASCGANNTLADNVVDIGLEPAFSAGDLAQFLLGILRPLLLQGCTEPSVSLAYLLGSLAGCSHAVACRGDVHHPEIDAEIFGWICGFTVGEIDGCIQPERPVPVHEVGLFDGFDCGEGTGFCVPEFDPSSQRPDADPGSPDREYPGIVADSPVVAEGDFSENLQRFAKSGMDIVALLDSLSGAPVTARNLADGKLRHLGGEAKGLSDLVVHLLLQSDVGELLFRKGNR